MVYACQLVKKIKPACLRKDKIKGENHFGSASLKSFLLCFSLVRELSFWILPCLLYDFSSLDSRHFADSAAAAAEVPLLAGRGAGCRWAFPWVIHLVFFFCLNRPERRWWWWYGCCVAQPVVLAGCGSDSIERARLVLVVDVDLRVTHTQAVAAEALRGNYLMAGPSPPSLLLFITAAPELRLAFWPCCKTIGILEEMSFFFRFLLTARVRVWVIECQPEPSVCCVYGWLGYKFGLVDFPPLLDLSPLLQWTATTAGRPDGRTARVDG